MVIRQWIAFFIFAMALTSCHSDDAAVTPNIDTSTVDAILSDCERHNPWDGPFADAPDEGCVRLRLDWTGRLKAEFNDSNHVHLSAARRLGFRPISSESDILNLSRPVVRVESNKDFYVDNLSHSFPYLVPEASDLLHEIGRRFNDTLQARGGGSYRIKATSLLRTPATVRKLSRVNRNASSESTHSFGTTFDISYSKFVCDDPNDTRRTFEDLKNLLGEILHDMRHEGKCYVKYEVKQSCFHITARPIENQTVNSASID